MKRQVRPETDQSLIERLVAVYAENQELVERFRNSLIDAIAGSKQLAPHIHSIRSRLKAPDHLRDKLNRKISECRAAARQFDITPENILVRVNDLAGVRILHLYTRQIREIDLALRTILEEQRYALLEGPFARTWDDESREFFRGCGITNQDSPSLYTSVHYVVGSASRTTVTCEIQVRTLMEEVWGEVDHSMNYPHRCDSLACREQLKVLARITSSTSRLVDSIFSTLDDHNTRKARAVPGAEPPARQRRRRRSARTKDEGTRRKSGA